MKTVTVVVSEDGETISVDLNGFHGKGCQKVLDDFAAGDKAKLVRDKREYHESALLKDEQKL